MNTSKATRKSTSVKTASSQIAALAPKGEVIPPPAASFDLTKVSTVQTALDAFVNSEHLSPADSRRASESTHIIVSKLQSAAENFMTIGETLNSLKADWGSKRFIAYYRAVLVAPKLMSESNIGLWMVRANILSETIPNDLIRTKLNLLTNGQGLVVRQAPTEEEKKDGAKGHYIVSPHVAEAMKEFPLPKGKVSEQLAEQYARTIATVVGKKRAADRTQPSSDKDAKKLKNAFERFFKAYGAGRSGALLLDMYAHFLNNGTPAAIDPLAAKFEQLYHASKVRRGTADEKSAAASQK